ncbi:MAG: hypothetical protein LBM23_00070 [Propionibacteriaceae bacterium]|jgi:hypothetical protein|nr:hypothetical protein [Propionibacteriaceae bacterium]
MSAVTAERLETAMEPTLNAVATPGFTPAPLLADHALDLLSMMSTHGVGTVHHASLLIESGTIATSHDRPCMNRNETEKAVDPSRSGTGRGTCLMTMRSI